MARRFLEEMGEWSRGVISETPADKVPKNAATRARNVAFVKNGFPSKRKGTSILTAAAQSGPARILDNGFFNDLNWVIDNSGRWSKIVDGALTPIDAAKSTPFTVTDYPATAAARGHLFAVNGTDAWKTDGITVSKFGMDAPTVPSAAAGAAGNPSGTYYIALTGYNSNTGHESSLSDDVTVVVVAQKITVSWTFPTDPQVTHVRVHIFKEGLSDVFFRLSSTNVSPAPDATFGGYTSATTSISVNITDTNINDLVVKSPSTTENNPPPVGTTFVAYHNSRMFATDGNYLYYSKIEDPESFDPAKRQPFDTDSTDKIVAFGPLKEELLVVLKDRSCHLLAGPDDPNTWEARPLDPTVGIIAHRSLVATGGQLWWRAPQGFYTIKVGGLPERFDLPQIGDRTASLNFTKAGDTTGAYDVTRKRLLFGVASEVSSVNDYLLSFNVTLGIWEDVWDPMDVSSLGNMELNMEPFVALGGYGGRMFRIWSTEYVDGVRVVGDDGLTLFTLSGNITSAGPTSLTDSGANFDTDDDGLDYIPVVIVAPDGKTQRNVIFSNTGTSLTLRDTWATTPDNTWAYFIGSPNFEFDTKHLAPTSATGVEVGSIFFARNFKHFMLKGTSDSGQTNLTIYSILDGDLTEFPTTDVVTLQGSGAIWDIDLWERGLFGDIRVTAVHGPLGVHGRTCGFRVVSREPKQGVVVLGLGLKGSELSHKA